MKAWNRGLSAVNDEPSQYDRATAERTLWVRVLLAQINDAHGRTEAMRPSERKHIQKQANGWIGGKDFRIVCDLAGLDADWIRDAYRAGKFAEMKQGKEVA